MKKIGVFLAGLLSLMMLAGALAKGSDGVESIRHVMDEQVAAWNRGDLEGFMDGYLRSPQTSYIGSDSELNGFDEIKDRYRKRYGSDTSSMGNLAFSDLKVLPLDINSALCTGHFNVARKDKPDASGVFSVIFVRRDGKWKIIHDHTTAFAPNKSS